MANSGRSAQRDATCASPNCKDVWNVTNKEGAAPNAPKASSETPRMASQPAAPAVTTTMSASNATMSTASDARKVSLGHSLTLVSGIGGDEHP